MHSLDDLRKREASLRAQILDLQHQLADVLTLQNSLRPAGQVHDDILLLVFASLVPTFSLDSHDAQVRAVSQVSRRWRTLALSSPTLWTDLFLWRDWEHIQEVLKRSRDVPLRIAIRDRPLPDRVRALVVSEAHRARAFAFRYQTDVWPSDAPGEEMNLLKILVASPAFKHLHLSHVDLREVKWEVGVPVPVVSAIESLQFLGTTDTLNIAILEPLVRSVTQFSFSWPTNHAVESHWVDQIANLLRYMPRLETLTISDIIKVYEHSPNVPVPRVALPQLAFLQADRVDHRELLSLLGRLDLPQTTRFRIKRDHNKLSTASSSSFFPAFRSVAFEREPASLRTFACDVPPSPGCGLPLTEITVSHIGHVNHLFFWEVARTMHSGGWAAPRQSDVGVETVDLVGFFDLPLFRDDGYFLGWVLPPCRTLRLVRCTPRAVSTLLRALLLAPGERSHPDTGPPYFRLLRHLDVRGLQSASVEEGAELRARLLELADRRREMGVPLERVSFSDV